MENPETLATLGTQDEDKQSKAKPQQRKLKKKNVHGGVPDTALCDKVCR
jgi:hypothetical protein